MKNSTPAGPTDAMDKKEEVQKSNDEHIDQDFEGYPKGPAKDSTIHPQTKADKLTAKTERPNAGTKKNPPKKKSEKPGDTTTVEKKLANNARSIGKATGGPNKVDRIKKQKK